jgi:hypothetical protein
VSHAIPCNYCSILTRSSADIEGSIVGWQNPKYQQHRTLARALTSIVLRKTLLPLEGDAVNTWGGVREEEDESAAHTDPNSVFTPPPTPSHDRTPPPTPIPSRLTRKPTTQTPISLSRTQSKGFSQAATPGHQREAFTNLGTPKIQRATPVFPIKVQNAQSDSGKMFLIIPV